MKLLNLEDLVKEVREDGDLFNETYITDGQIARKLNKNFKILYKVYCDSDLGFFVRTFSDISLLTLKSITLPQDFYKLASLDKKTIDGFIPVQKINYSGREAYEDIEFHGDNFLEYLKFYFEDETIRILPESYTGGVYRLRYYPEAPLIESGQAKIYEEHTDYVTYATIAELKMKSEDNWQEFKVKSEEVMKAVRRQFMERSFDIPETIADVYSSGPSDELYYDNFLNNYVTAERDFEPQLQAEDTFEPEPLDFCFEFEEIPFVDRQPVDGVKGVVNRGFDRFDSLNVSLKDRDNEVLYSAVLDSQTFDIELPDTSFEDWTEYTVDVDGVTEDPVSDRLETKLKPIYVSHEYKKYDDIDLTVIPAVFGASISNVVKEGYGVSFPDAISSGFLRIHYEETGGSVDGSTSIFNNLTGQPRDIQWLGIYEREIENVNPQLDPSLQKFFSLVYRREKPGEADGLAPGNFTIYPEDGEAIPLALTANNVVSGGNVEVYIEKAVAITDEIYNKLRDSDTWRFHFLPASNWYLSQNYGRRKFIEGAIDLSPRRIKVASGAFTYTAEGLITRPLDGFDSNEIGASWALHGLNLLTGLERRLSTNLNVSAENSNQILWTYPNSNLDRRYVFGMKDIQDRELAQFSKINRVKFFNVQSTNFIDIEETEDIETITIGDDKVLFRPVWIENPNESYAYVPRGFKHSILRVYTPYTQKSEGNIQIEFRNASLQTLNTQQLKYGYEPVKEDVFVQNLTGLTFVKFLITELSGVSDEPGFIPTRVFVTYYNMAGDVKLLVLTDEDVDVRLDNIDIERPVTVAVA